ncbi:hypothetical protein RJ640_010573 [Escallonia rubra]|uniref:Transposase (putative) gypsy type domain-containing protein n=1 Tax=Escallonia rubra TaxID=112253 RepID=A0AA88QNZ5_9ASTE|nr:hypothetical protein RJ640_010573 [Escallonia rubra]
MTKESIIELLEEFPLPPHFSARVLALQEPANYGTDLETSVNESQIKSGNRIPMHPFTVAFFNYYKMTPGQLVPNGWRKLVGLIYLVQTSWYPVTVHDFMRLYLEVCFIKNVAKSVGWYYIHNRVKMIKWGPKFNKDYEKKGFMAPNALIKKLLDHIKRRGSLSIDEPLTDQEIRHAGLIPPAPTIHVPPTLIVESRAVLRHKTSELAARTSSSRTPSLEMSGKGKAPPLVVEDLPVDKDPIFSLRWTIKRGDSGMPSSHAYCYSSQMQDRFAMAMDMVRKAEVEKRAAVSKADRLGNEVDDLKVENTELLAKVNRLEKRCEKLKKFEADTGNKAIQAFLDGIAREEWLRKRTEDGLSIFQEGETVAPTEAGNAVSQGDRNARSGNTPAP